MCITGGRLNAYLLDPLMIYYIYWYDCNGHILLIIMQPNAACHSIGLYCAEYSKLWKASMFAWLIVDSCGCKPPSPSFPNILSFVLQHLHPERRVNPYLSVHTVAVLSNSRMELELCVCVWNKPEMYIFLCNRDWKGFFFKKHLCSSILKYKSVNLPITFKFSHCFAV